MPGPVLAISISQILSELGYLGLVLLMIAEGFAHQDPAQLDRAEEWFRRRGAVMVSCSSRSPSPACCSCARCAGAGRPDRRRISRA